MKYLIAGLGNIGTEYRKTRHNIGFMVLEALMEDQELSPASERYALTASAKHKGRSLQLIMPTTYMNLSGKAIRHHMQKHQIPIERLLVITDDIALPFGTLRLKGKGSAGGHNGLKNIEELLNTRQYARMRFGVGDSFSKGRQVDYVLGDFSNDEEAELPLLIDKCIKGIYSFVSIGLDRTMNSFNSRA